MDFDKSLIKRKSQKRYEIFHCSETQSHRLTADKLFVDLIVNMVLDYLKKTVRNLFTINTNIQEGIPCKKSSETFQQNHWKIPKKAHFQ